MSFIGHVTIGFVTLALHLINFSNKANVITLVYAKKLGFQTKRANIKAQKIVSLSLDIFEIIVAKFKVLNKLNRAYFFQ